MSDQPYLPFESFTDRIAVSSELEEPGGKPDYKVEFSKEYLLFAPVDEGEMSEPQKVRLYNRGKKPIRFRSFNLVGDFRLYVPYEGPLYPDEYYELTVTFFPERQGFISGGIYVDGEEIFGNRFIKLGGVGGDASDPNIITIYEAGFASIGTFTWSEDLLNTLTNITLPNTVT